MITSNLEFSSNDKLKRKYSFSNSSVKQPFKRKKSILKFVTSNNNENQIIK
jgi:hypothetical protein